MKRKVICSYCNKEFETINYKKKYCSDECHIKGGYILTKIWYEKNRKVSNIIFCRMCGKQFESKTIPRKKYCSTECLIKEKKHINLKCHKKRIQRPDWKKYRQEVCRRYYLKHKEAIIKRIMDRRHKNWTQYSRWRKARRYGTGQRLNVATIQRVYEDNIKKYGTLTCILCNKPIDFGQDSLEHLIPLSRGGSNLYENLGISHRLCNCKKLNKTMEEYHLYAKASIIG